MTKEKTQRGAEMFLLMVITLRSTSLLFGKIGLRTMTPETMLALRFMLAFAILLVIFRKKLAKIDRETFRHGMIIGFFFFMTMMFETTGLDMTDSSTTSFIENTAIILVPLVNAILVKKLPGAAAFASGAVALIGVGLITLGGGSTGFSRGQIMCIGSAIFYTLTIIVTDRYSKVDDAAMLGVLQVGFIAVASTISALLNGGITVPTDRASWGALIFLAIVCTCFGFTLQPVAQKNVSVEKAGLFCAVNPLVTAILGAAFLGERLGPNGLAGGALILASIVIPVAADSFGRKRIETSPAAADGRSTAERAA